MTSWKIHARHPRRAPRRARLEVEVLESRTVPYAVSGNMWPNPQLVTLSFEPDGTNLGGVYSNMFSVWNGHFGNATNWENAILKAAQSWAQVTNLNFAVVSDNGTGSGGGLFQQGDPGMGDIRIGGYNYNNPNLLALADQPPPINNFSIAGDIAFNTGMPFNINGAAYDLYTVAMHEIGHALGMDHSTSTFAAMYPYYTRTMTALGPDDVAGIQSIYGVGRTPDAFDAAASNNTQATASDISGLIDPVLVNATVNNLDISTTSDVDYYSFTAPLLSGNTLTATVQSSGLSLLAPSLKIYDASGTLLGSATGSGDFGSTISKAVSVTPGQQYFVRVAGANTTPFGTGAYALGLQFGLLAPLPAASPSVPILNGIPLSGGGGSPDRTGGHGHYGNGHGGDLDPYQDALTVAPGAQGQGSVLGGPRSLAVSPFAPQFVSHYQTDAGTASEESPPASDSGDAPVDGALAARTEDALESHAGTWESAVDTLFADAGWGSE